MNYLFLSKKVNVCSAYLNLISSVGWISLTLLIAYYHIHVLHSDTEYYKSFPWKSFLANPFDNLKQRTPTSSVQETNSFAHAYIQKNGLSSFFSEQGFWAIIQPLYLISIITSVTNLLLALVSWFCFCKARNFNYLVSSLASLLIPIFGGLLSLKINGRLSAIWGPKAIKYTNPAQSCKFKAKLILSKLWGEPTIPTY